MSLPPVHAGEVARFAARDPLATPLLEISDAIAVAGRDPAVPQETRSTARNAWAARVLAGATGRHDIALDRRPSGRPRLAPPYPELGVSLSASAGHVLAGFSPTAAVGVDIEVLDTSLDPRRFATDHYSPPEAAAVSAANPDAALDLCLRLWVAKEAALKISGRGVFDGLAEPNLASVLDDLMTDGQPVRPSCGTARTALVVATCRWSAPDDRMLYAALAVAA